MNVNLEQSLAAVVRFIQDNSEEGTQLYFDEIPENFYVPSVYFQIPYSAGRKATLSSYCTTMTMNIWFILIDDINISLSDQSVIVPSGKQPLQAGDQWYLLAVNRNKIYYFLDKI